MVVKVLSGLHGNGTVYGGSFKSQVCLRITAGDSLKVLQDLSENHHRWLKSKVLKGLPGLKFCNV